MAAGDPLAVLQMDRRDLLGVPGPAEGALSRGLPGWQVDAMREDGLPLVDAPLVLTRDTLHGTVPEPDGVGVLVAAMFGGTTGLTFGAIALGFHRAYRRLLARGTGATPTGRTLRAARRAAPASSGPMATGLPSARPQRPGQSSSDT